MYRTRNSCLIGLFAAVALVGCGTQQTNTATYQYQASTQLAMQADQQVQDDGVYYLGAGDSLGQEIYLCYVRELQDEERYATGVDDRPADE